MKRILIMLAALLVAVPAFGADAPYIARGEVDLTHLIAPPPTPDSAQGQREIAEVLETRAAADEAERARAVADAEVSIFRFADVLGPKFRAGRSLAKTEAFFDRVRREIGPFAGGSRAHWHRDRPFVVDPNVHAPDALVKGACNDTPGPGSAATPACPNGVSYSSPSGHATYGALVAILLGEMVPEKREALLARGWEFGHNRVVVGVHFPSDIEAGRTAAAIMVVLLTQSPRFRADLAESRAELRAALSLPPDAPAAR